MSFHPYLRVYVRVCAAVLAALAGCTLAACSRSTLPSATRAVVAPDAAGAAAAVAAFRLPEKPRVEAFMSRADLALIEESNNPVYRLGSGDAVKVDVFGRPELSGRHLVGPDGIITLPLGGDVQLGEHTREEARGLVEQKLRRFFTVPHVTLAVEDYGSNRVTVLGRVERAGVQKFAHPPTLAEVLAAAGAMPLQDKQNTPSRCAILRGRDKLVWVDLKALFNGDTAYNLRMKRGDIVFIPDAAELPVYVLGQVGKPGSYRLTPRMTVLDALAQAGGPNEDAKSGQIALYRAGAKTLQTIDLQVLTDPARLVNYVLEEGDVLFVPKRGIAEWGYVMRQVLPGMSVLKF